jgi:phosphosulfolactate synthase
VQDRVDAYVAWIRELGLDLVEVSDGTITLDEREKRSLITRLVRDGFTVLSEVGSKDAEEIMAPYRWVEQIEAELEAGAWKVICEGRETGTAGIARPDGELRQGLIDEIAHAVDPAQVIFEAPQKDQQVVLIKRFGADVNLGNIPPHDVLALETMRLGLRSDTMDGPRR